MYLVVENSERAKQLLPIYVVTLGADFIQPPSHRKNGAPFHHIFFVEKGIGRFSTREGTWNLKEGDALFMQKGYPVHYQGLGADFRTGWVTFDGEGVEGMLRYFDAAPFSFQSAAPLYEFRRACIKAAERKAPSEQLSKLAYDLLTTYFLSLHEKPQSSKLSNAKRYIEAHYVRDLSVGEIAEAIGISSSLLYRLFRKEQGGTPVEYLRTVRIRHAKRLLLEDPSLSVSAIAAACGFADVAYFCKVFRDCEHMTPREYRMLYIS